MTPFVEDFSKFLYGIKESAKNTICYFFGHQYTPWEENENNHLTSIKARRECKRCDETDYSYQYKESRQPKDPVEGK